MRIPVLSTLLLSAFLILSCVPEENQANHVLWYEYPATYWNSQSLHLGNAFLGASFFGGVEREQLALTEGSMWTGGPFQGDWEDWGVRAGVQDCVKAIRRAVQEGNIPLADSLSRDCYLGQNRMFGHFSSIGDLYLEMGHSEGGYEDYIRRLDLANSLGTVAYSRGGIRFEREYFCSYPHRVLAVKIRSDHRGMVDFRMGMEVIQDRYEVKVSDASYVVDGLINGGADRRFRVEIRALPFGGSAVVDGKYLHVQSCDSVVLLLCAATDYRQDYPAYLGEDPAITCGSILDRAEKTGYAGLKKAHVEDYRSLYDRTSIDLHGDPGLEGLPTNVRWENLVQGLEDPGLMELAFNLGRYLIISSSRPGSLPANLQGKWNTFYVPPWTGNYQANINIQEIYWSCGPVNLLECQEPYIEWTRDLVKSGREMARQAYGTEGWISHTIGNIWGHTAPVGGIPWGVYPLAPVWHCQHLWEQFRFSMDTAYLEQIAYPIIREATLFWLENLVEYGEHLIVAPTISAEHGAFLEEFGKVCYNMPSQQDAQMLRDLFGMCMEGAAVLDADHAFVDSVKTTADRLLPPQVGKYGQLQEWFPDIDSPEDRHRHIAHLYGLCPGSEIHPLTSPELAEAARKSLDLRGDGRFMDFEIAAGGNWSRAWRIWCWTRLMDGDRAHKIFSEMLGEQGFENLTTFQHAEYAMGRADLFQEPDSMFLHFQLDASASTPGFMAEMLLQSHLGSLILLPALPPTWTEGNVRGLKARGGYELDIYWKKGRLEKAVISGGHGRVPEVLVEKRVVDPLTDPRIEFILEP